MSKTMRILQFTIRVLLTIVYIPVSIFLLIGSIFFLAPLFVVFSIATEGKFKVREIYREFVFEFAPSPIFGIWGKR